MVTFVCKVQKWYPTPASPDTGASVVTNTTSMTSISSIINTFGAELINQTSSDQVRPSFAGGVKVLFSVVVVVVVVVFVFVCLFVFFFWGGGGLCVRQGVCGCEGTCRCVCHKFGKS